MPPIAFPVKLWEAVNSKDDELIRWSCDGREVLVNEGRFGELIERLHPSLLRQPTLFSFRRLLRWYDFASKPSQDDIGTGRYYHPLFARGRPDQIKLIVPRIPTKRGRTTDSEQLPRDLSSTGTPGSNKFNRMERSIQQFFESMKMVRHPPGFDHRLNVASNYHKTVLPPPPAVSYDDDLVPGSLSSFMEFSLRRFPGLDIDNVAAAAVPTPVVVSTPPPPVPMPPRHHQLFKVRLRDFSHTEPAECDKVGLITIQPSTSCETLSDRQEPALPDCADLPLDPQLEHSIFGLEDNEPWFGLSDVPAADPVEMDTMVDDPYFAMSDFPYTNLLPVKNEDWQLTELF